MNLLWGGMLLIGISFMGCAALTLGIAAAFGVFWFGLTVWLMRNRLNME